MIRENAVSSQGNILERLTGSPTPVRWWTMENANGKKQILHFECDLGRIFVILPGDTANPAMATAFFKLGDAGRREIGGELVLPGVERWQRLSKLLLERGNA